MNFPAIWPSSEGFNYNNQLNLICLNSFKTSNENSKERLHVEINLQEVQKQGICT